MAELLSTQRPVRRGRIDGRPRMAATAQDWYNQNGGSLAPSYPQMGGVDDYWRMQRQPSQWEKLQGRRTAGVAPREPLSPQTPPSDGAVYPPADQSGLGQEAKKALDGAQARSIARQEADYAAKVKAFEDNRKNENILRSRAAEMNGAGIVKQGDNGDRTFADGASITNVGGGKSVLASQYGSGSSVTPNAPSASDIASKAIDAAIPAVGAPPVAAQHPSAPVLAATPPAAPTVPAVAPKVIGPTYASAAPVTPPAPAPVENPAMKPAAPGFAPTSSFSPTGGNDPLKPLGAPASSVGNASPVAVNRDPLAPIAGGMGASGAASAAAGSSAAGKTPLGIAGDAVNGAVQTGVKLAALPGQAAVVQPAQAVAGLARKGWDWLNKPLQ